MDFEKLNQFLSSERLTVEEDIEAKQILLDIEAALSEKEVYVKEPDDINDEEVMIWTKSQLNKLRELDVVNIATELGIAASVQDKKTDTIQKILDKQAQ